jgi:hypothetical protein
MLGLFLPMIHSCRIRQWWPVTTPLLYVGIIFTNDPFMLESTLSTSHCVYVRGYICTFYKYIGRCISVFVCIYMYVCIYIYTYICIHTHILYKGIRCHPLIYIYIYIYILVRLIVCVGTRKALTASAMIVKIHILLLNLSDTAMSAVCVSVPMNMSAYIHAHMHGYRTRISLLAFSECVYIHALETCMCA